MITKYSAYTYIISYIFYIILKSKIVHIFIYSNAFVDEMPYAIIDLKLFFFYIL